MEWISSLIETRKSPTSKIKLTKIQV